MQRFVSDPLPVPAGPWARADLELTGIDHSGDSFVVLLYLDNPDADADTGRGEGTGFATSFTVFGHGECWGDAGHCRVEEPVSPFDRRPPHALVPIDVTVTITDALRRVAGEETIVTALAFLAGPEPRDQDTGILLFDELSLVVYA